MTSNNGTPDAPRHGTPVSAPPEMTEFLQRFRGKTPEQMLGLPPGNGLWPATAFAGVVTAVLLLGFTAVPFVMAKMKPAAAAKTTAPTTEPAAPPADAPKPTAKADNAKAATPTAKADAATPKAAPDPAGKAKPGPDILDKLGENTTKTASPKVNPLDNKNDDIFKDLK